MGHGSSRLERFFLIAIALIRPVCLIRIPIAVSVGKYDFLPDKQFWGIRPFYPAFLSFCRLLETSVWSCRPYCPLIHPLKSMFHIISFGRMHYLLTLYHFFELEKSLYKTMQHEAKQAKANEIVRNHVGFSLGAALIPFPGADLLAVTTVQLNMLRQLAKLYDVGFMDMLGKNIISAVAGSSAARLGASLVKAIPGVGTIIGELSMPALSGASTYALGKVVASHFHLGGSLDNLDLRNARRGYETEMEDGKKVADQLAKNQPSAASPTDEAMDKLKKLAELKAAGIITDEEFAQLKTKLLSQI